MNVDLFRSPSLLLVCNFPPDAEEEPAGVFLRLGPCEFKEESSPRGFFFACPLGDTTPFAIPSPSSREAR